MHLVGWHSAKTGDFEEARLHVGQLMAVATEQTVPLGMASAHLGYGFIAHYEGRYPEALEEYAKARQTFSEHGGEERLAYTDELCGDTHRAAGDPASTRAAWQAAKRGYLMFGMLVEAERIAAKLKELDED